MTPVTRILAVIDRFRRQDDGQGLAEYALILALIAIVAIVALLFLGTQISDKLSIVGSTLNSVAPSDRRNRTSEAARRTTVRRAVSLSGNSRRTGGAPPAAQPCSLPCTVRDFLHFPPYGPSPLV